MSRISKILPLPGIPELEALAQGFVNRLKDAEFECDKRAALARRLDCLIERANTLSNPVELTRNLLDIQQRFKAADATSSRLGIRGAQRKLAIWDDLCTKLDETMEVGMLDMMAQLRHTQTQQARTQQLMQLHKSTAASRMHKMRSLHQNI
ncbi:hypothetical protein BDV93DRAFT_526314 [Ceratobasidium sp. AG-I]|nr:hypothetical protein BDV93DRAFT_526314 [Ceratobasidium sp. AG-I]